MSLFCHIQNSAGKNSHKYKCKNKKHNVNVRWKNAIQSGKGTYNFEHIPVEDVIVSEALFVEEIAEQLA